MSDEALALDGIVKRYGAVAALDHASLAVQRRTLHAVLGENGAGKTTLMRVAFGLVSPDEGVLRIDGVPHRFDTPRDALAAGIGMVHQHFTIVPAMTVAENVALGGTGRYDPRTAADRVRTIGDATGLHLDPAALASTLGVAAQQRLEILKALARGGTGANTSGARLLILDEPAAVLAPSESDELLRWLRAWVNAGGTAVLVTHKLRDALRYADAVTVLRRGTTVFSGPVDRTDQPAQTEQRFRTDRYNPSQGTPVNERALTAAMLGEPVADTADRQRTTPGPDAPVIARLAGVHVIDDAGVARLRDVTVALRGGSITGVAAVEGSGQHELLRVLAGRLTPTAGETTLPATIAFVPEDRHRDALLLDGSLAENLALAGAGTRRGHLAWTRLRSAVNSLIAAADVRGGAANTPARTLSGGNQQKFVVARELADAPPLVVAENPTRGLDVRAAAGVRTRLRAAADAGASVVVYASDLDEVLALADTMLVVYQGTVHRAPVDRHVVGRLMLGAPPLTAS